MNKMNCFRCRILSSLESLTNSSILKFSKSRPSWQKPPKSIPQRPQRRHYQSEHQNPAETDPNWMSLAEKDPVYMKTKQKHGPGLIILALIPITAFAMGTWQVKRLQWKSDLIAKLEDQLVRQPLPLPPHVDPKAIPEFDHRRVVLKGRYRHDQEMLIGPRMREGKEGYIVVTPFERDDGASKVLISRGWIEKEKGDPRSREAEALPQGVVEVEGLLREPPKKNYFTPDNKPEDGKFYFPDVAQMAEITGSQVVWIEETMEPELFEMMNRARKGVPLGRPPTVQLHNSHAQYIVTWYGLAAATTVMFLMILKKAPAATTGGRVRKSGSW